MTKFTKTTVALLACALALPMAVNAQSGAMTAPTAKAKKAMSYDCSKPGNKNKAACKAAAATTTTTTTTAASAAKPVAAAKPVTAAKPMTSLFKPSATSTGAGAGKVTTTKAASLKTPSNNPNEVAYTTKTGKVIHYDCSKAGNKNKQACKGH